MKPLIILFAALFSQTALYAQYETVMYDMTDGVHEIMIPEGKVVEVKTFTHVTSSRPCDLSLEKDGREYTVLLSTFNQVATNNGVMMSFAGPSILRVRSLITGAAACLTYRIIDNDDPNAEPVRPIVQVRTICRCRRGR